MDLISEVDAELRRVFGFGSGVRVIYSRVEEFSEPEPGPHVDELDLPRQVVEGLKRLGVERLYRFQWEAAKAVLDGYSVIIVAGTGTGKTEAFLLPILVDVFRFRGPNPRALILYPTKALARDQLARLNRMFLFGGVRGAVYDGDTPKRVRELLSSAPPEIVVSNPDMIHVGLVTSEAIRRFVSSARFVVFDELHVYEGVLGSHVRAVVERMRRARGSDPVFIGSSATIGNPKEHAENLFGVEVKVVEGSRRRRGSAIHALVSAGHLSRWTVAAGLASILARRGLRVLVFTDSQQMAELIARIARRQFRVELLVHRAGLPAEERRKVEAALRSGEAVGVVATPTLELGMDIGFLDAVVMASPPPSFAKYLQRAGRAGRRGNVGYVFTVLGEDPIDSYYERNPEKFFDQEVTPVYIEPDNEEVLKVHLLALLLSEGRVKLSELRGGWRVAADELLREGLAAVRGGLLIPSRGAFAEFMARASIRGTGRQVKIVDRATGSAIGWRELPLAILELHPGAIYMHGGKVYISRGIDVERGEAYVEQLPEDVPYYTKPLYTVDVEDFEVLDERVTSRGVPIAYARVSLIMRVEGYVVKAFWEKESLRGGSEELLLEPLEYRFRTKAVLVKYPGFPEWGFWDHAEAYHASEHALIEAARPVVGAG